MKNRLFDFSAATAAMTVAAYVLLMTLFGFTYFNAQKPVIYGVVFILLAISFIFIFVWFVILSVKLDKNGVHHGDKFIKKKNLRYTLEYDTRFKESVIIFSDKNHIYKSLDKKEEKKKTIRVQATASNVRKLSEYTHDTIEIPKAPKRRGLFRRRGKQ